MPAAAAAIGWAFVVAQMMALTGILGRYFARQFVLVLVVMLTLLLTVVYFLEIAELFRRTAEHSVAAFTVLNMGAIKLPYTGQVMLPFVVLFAAIFTLWRMAQRRELVVARAAGLSWASFMQPALLIVFAFGVMNVTIFSPVSAALQMQYQRLENKYIEGGSTLNITGTGLWLRQPYDGGTAVIHAPQMTAEPRLALQNVLVLLLGPDEEYVGRLDAQTGELLRGRWILREVKQHQPDKPMLELSTYEIPTNLTKTKVEDSLAQPETLSFWELPGFIEALNRTGFNSTRHLQHYYALLAQPVYFMGMVLLAAVFMQRQLRSGRALMLLLGVLGAGVGVFVLNNTVLALGITEVVPTLLAAFAVPVACCVLCIAALLYLENG